MKQGVARRKHFQFPDGLQMISLLISKLSLKLFVSEKGIGLF